jgi:hypothetical protein
MLEEILAETIQNCARPVLNYNFVHWPQGFEQEGHVLVAGCQAPGAVARILHYFFRKDAIKNQHPFQQNLTGNCQTTST